MNQGELAFKLAQTELENRKLKQALSNLVKASQASAAGCTDTRCKTCRSLLEAMRILLVVK